MDEDFDLETFVDLFDTAMSSDNPTVKKSFKNLLMVAALTENENKIIVGPLRSLLKTVETLQQKVATLETSQYKNNMNNMNTVYGPVTTVGTPYTTTNPMPTWIAPTYSYTSVGGGGGASSSYSIDTITLDNIYQNLGSK